MRSVLSVRWAVAVIAAATVFSGPGLANTIDMDGLFGTPQRAAEPQVPAAPERTSGPEVPAAPGVPEAVRDVLITAREAFLAGDHARAAEQAQRVTTLAPDTAEGWHLLGLARANLADFDGAVEALGRAGELYTRNAEPYVVQGDILMAAGDAGAALAAFERAVVRDPENWRAFEGLARARGATGDIAGTRAALAAAVSALGPASEGDLEPRVGLARGLTQAGDVPAALALLSDFAAAHPDSAEALLMLGRMQIVADDNDAAALSLSRAVALSEDPMPALLALATAQERRGDTSAAREALLSVRERRPEWPLVHIRLGEVEMAADRATAAVAHFQEAVDVAGDDRLADEARLRLATAQLLAGAPAEVEATLAPLGRAADADAALAVRALAALALDDADAALDLLGRAETAAPFVEVADVLVEEQGYDLAERVLVAARDRHPDAVEPLGRLGRLYGALRRYDEGLVAFEAALELAPDRTEFARGAMLISYRTGDVAAARDRAERLVAGSDPADAGDLVWLATFASAEGDIDGAQDAYERAIALQPDNWIAMNNLASLVTADDPARAAMLAGRAAEIAPGVSTIRHTLGWALYNSGDLAEAEAVYRALTEEEPDVARTAYRLGVILMDRGQSGDGAEQLRRALVLDTEFDGADDARARLEAQ